MVRIFSSNIIDMQRNQGMIYEPLEELVKQVDVKIAHCAPQNPLRTQGLASQNSLILLWKEPRRGA